MPEPEKTFGEETQLEFSYTLRQTLTDVIGVKGRASFLDAKNKAIERLRYISSSQPRITEVAKKVIEDQLSKLESLELIVIPMADGTKNYYSIADSAGGVTEKICLIDQDQLMTKLAALKRATTYQDVEANKIRMNAILKYPKAGKDTEVQREEIGLNIARLLGFTHVTNSTLVSHDTGKGRHPCLFVPFGDMDLLTEAIENKQSLHGRLRRESMSQVEDFGKYSAFFMLCGDPDFIGKDGQNKGLTRNNPSKKLYIFDQVFMKETNFGLDRSFNIVPTNIASRMPNFIARHFMGRNRSVINDSSYEEKVKGALQVLERQRAIREMFQQIAKANQGKKLPPKEAAIAAKLQSDANACLKSFNSRIQNIRKLFPAIKIDNKVVSIDNLPKDAHKVLLLNKAMLFNQLMNTPQLFDKSGKPYRAPFFCNHQIRVKQISFEANDIVKITFGGFFSSRISASKQALLEQQGFTVSPDGKSATISSDSLLKLNEQSFFKEQKDEIDMEHNYLDTEKIRMLAATYHEKGDQIIAILEKIEKAPNREQALYRGLGDLDQLNIKNKGFIQHIKQCLLYEAGKVIITKNPAIAEAFRNTFTSSKKAGKLENDIIVTLGQMISRQSNAREMKVDLIAIAKPPNDRPVDTVTPPKPGFSK